MLKTHVSVLAHAMNQVLCLNLSMSDMPHSKIESCFKSPIFLCKTTILIVHLLSSSRYHAPCRSEYAAYTSTLSDTHIAFASWALNVGATTALGYSCFGQGPDRFLLRSKRFCTFFSNAFSHKNFYPLSFYCNVSQCTLLSEYLVLFLK